MTPSTPPPGIALGSPTQARASFVTQGAIALLLLVSLPFLAAQHGPGTDLGQHAAQLRLLHETLQGGRPELEVNWGAPGIGVYLVMEPISWLVGMERVGWATLWALVVAWAGAFALVANQRGRDPGAVVLGGLFVFGAGVYWGFLQFLIGWPLFMLWFMAVERWRLAPGPPRAAVGRVGALALALYLAHSLWLVVGLLWLLARLPGARLSWSRLVALAAALTPAAALAVYWLPNIHLYRTGIVSGYNATLWTQLPWERLGFSALRRLLLGGLRGQAEAAFLLAVLAWIALGAASYARTPRAYAQALDRPLLGLAGFVWALSLFAPNQTIQTFYLPERFAGGAMMLLLVALPAPRLPALARLGVPLVISAAFALATTAAWGLHEDEWSGYDAALAALPEGKRLVALDFTQGSDEVTGRPFLHTAAAMQAVRGGDVNFTFADFGSGVVRKRIPRLPAWYPDLTWDSWRVSPRDLSFFDYALVHGNPDTQTQFQRLSGGQTEQYDAPFRLYRLPDRHQP